MKLTDKEQEICKQYGAYDDEGFVHCKSCPLNLESHPDIVDRYGNDSLICYATIDGRVALGMKLRRY